MPTELLFLKPLLTALALPPALGIWLALLGWWLMLRNRSRWGAALVGLSLLGLWMVSCNAVAIWLDRNFLPQTIALAPDQVVPTLRQQQMQAIIVLGGGAETASREYGQAQPAQATVTRLHYGVVLAKSSGLPLGFSGGIGWAASDAADTEAAAAQRWAAQLGLAPLRWLEGGSRDTQENAQKTAALLKKDGITRIALVTNAWHMPRARRAFENAGLMVLPAPMGYTEPVTSATLEWLPSAHGLRHARWVLHEMLGLVLGQ